jgi:hypothetical protein
MFVCLSILLEIISSHQSKVKGALKGFCWHTTPSKVVVVTGTYSSSLYDRYVVLLRMRVIEKKEKVRKYVCT